MRRRSREVAVAAVVALAIVGGCGGGGVPFFGYDGAPIGIEVTTEAAFRDAMASYGMKRADIDCMLAALAQMGHQIVGLTRLDGSVLQSAAQQCGVDTSKLHRSGD